MKNSLICLVLFLSPAVHVVAKNVDLSTVPPRDTVQLTIYNSEDLTLVRETRRISLKQGVNPLQFSWANTLIDPSRSSAQCFRSATRSTTSVVRGKPWAELATDPPM